MTTVGWLLTGPRRRQLGYLALVLLVVLGVGLLVHPCDSRVSDLRLCHDEACSEVVSLGKTTLPYNSKDPDVLSFPANTDVKVYSKQAGKRTDLWGVEIQNRRGYAPMRFIKEYKILKKDLNFTVPTEDKYNVAENATDKVEKLAAVITEQDQAQVPPAVQPSFIDAINRSEETITNPPEVSPSYETIIDGTVIPVDIEEATPLQPSYSTQTVQDNTQSAEEVQLDVYPNILSSTFNAISEILGGSEDSSESASVEVASSEGSVIDQTTEKTPEIESPDDESSPTSEETRIPPVEAEPALPENEVESVVEEQTPEPIATDSVVSETVPQFYVTPADESTADEEDATTTVPESAVPSESLEAVVDADNASENDTETDGPVESEVDESNEVPSSVESPETEVEEEDAKVLATESGIVPKVEEVVPVTVETDAAAASQDSLQDQEDVSNSTSNYGESEDDVASPSPPTEVPLESEIKEETIPAPSEPVLPIVEPTLQPSLSVSDSAPVESTETADVSQNETETSAFMEEPKPVIEEPVNFDKQFEIHVVDSDNATDDSYAASHVPTAYLQQNDTAAESADFGSQPADSSRESIVDVPSASSFSEFLGSRNLLNAAEGSDEIGVDEIATGEISKSTVSYGSEEIHAPEVQQVEETTTVSSEEIVSVSPISDVDKVVLPSGTCEKGIDCLSEETVHHYAPEQNAVTSDMMVVESSYTLMCVCITAVTILLFSLGCYFLEIRRRDAYLITKINKLEKDLMITRKECIMLDENFKSTKTKLDSIEDESFGSNEMVLSLKAELEASEKEKEELREQIASLEKDLEGASEAGLELERMLREILASQSEDNPLAQSIQDLQDRLNDQQNANVALTNALALKTQENETLTGDLAISLKKVEQLQAEVGKLAEELTTEADSRMSLEQSLADQVQQLEVQIKGLTEDKSHLRKQLKMKELEVKELLGVVEQTNSNNLDFDKLYEVSHIKAEAAHLQEERDELRMKLSEEEGAHQLLEEHVKLVKEEVGFLSEQCRVAEKEKKEAETRLEVLTKFFEEKEAQRQKEEAIWLEKQGEVSSTVERIQTMQNELLNYKQQIEMLKREILDQEREYKNQISLLETKAHEHWVAARQNERRLEEVKAESSQLRNRLTLVEKNMNDTDPEVKLHRLQHHQQANGDTSALFPGDNPSSPLMFAGAPLPPPSYFHGMPPPPPPFLPPPLPSSGEAGVGSRPAPLGSVLDQKSPPSLSPPPLLPHHGFPPHHLPHHHHALHSPPPLMMGPPPPPPLHRYPPQQDRQQDSSGNWSTGDSMPGPRNSAAFQHVQQRSRNHKGSLHSSGESLDKSYGGKV